MIRVPQPGELTEVRPGVFVLGSVQGLVSEAPRVATAFRRVAPAVVALGVATEDVAGLVAYAASPDEDDFSADSLLESEAVFAASLAKFGPVDLPPPDLREAIRLAQEADIPVVGIDLGEDAYADVWSREVNVFELWRVSRAARRLHKRPPVADSAHAFALAWDAEHRRVPGLARVEAAREREMGRALRSFSPTPALVIVELARFDGVIAACREDPVTRPSA